MQVKLLDYGVPSEMQPKRAHANDVGADVYALKDRIIEVGCSAVIGLGFGLDLPAGFGAFIFPRSSQTAKGVDCKLPPARPWLYRGNARGHSQRRSRGLSHLPRRPYRPVGRAASRDS